MKIKFEIIEFNKNIDDIYLIPTIAIAVVEGELRNVFGIGVKFLKFIACISITINKEIKC